MRPTGPRVGFQEIQQHVSRYLATTRPLTDIEEAVSCGLLGSPLLGTWTSCSSDSCHAWSNLGHWLPFLRQLKENGRGMAISGVVRGYRERQPNFHEWAKPAYEQGALPILCLLALAVEVLWQDVPSYAPSWGLSSCMSLVQVPKVECRTIYDG